MERVIVAEVSKRYLDAKGNPFHALDQVSFTWDRGTNLAVTGESGSGKSTLARLLIGIEPPTLGEITLDGENIARWNFRRWRKARRHIQAVFQDAAGTMDPAYSVYRNMEETLRNLTTLNSAQRKKTILELMELTRMDQHLLEEVMQHEEDFRRRLVDLQKQMRELEELGDRFSDAVDQVFSSPAMVDFIIKASLEYDDMEKEIRRNEEGREEGRRLMQEEEQEQMYSQQEQHSQLINN